MDRDDDNTLYQKQLKIGRLEVLIQGIHAVQLLNLTAYVQVSVVVEDCQQQSGILCYFRIVEMGETCLITWLQNATKLSRTGMCRSMPL